MKNQRFPLLFVLFLILNLVLLNVQAQQWIQDMPGYDRYKEVSPQIRSSVKPGQISVKWADDGKSFTYSAEGKRYQFDLKKKKAVELGDAEKEESGTWPTIYNY